MHRVQQQYEANLLSMRILEKQEPAWIILKNEKNN